LLDKENEQENRKAIVIGINKYESDPIIPRLDGAENDAIEISDRLIKYGNFEVSKNHYLVGPDATRRNILKAVSEVFQKDNTSDLILFYFSGQVIIDKRNFLFLVPYDIDPKDPFISSIDVEDLKKVILNSNNKTSIIFILDCCYAGVITKEIIRAETLSEYKYLKNLYSTNLKKIIESSTQGQGKIVLASSEANAVSREKNYCLHSENDSPHTHGAFSYHLIEGLEGKAADPDTGIISIDNLKRYIENQMLAEQKQKPIYYVTGVSNFDNIKIAISQGIFGATINKLINQAEELVSRSDSRTNLVDMFSLQDAAKKVNELISLKRDHPAISLFQDKINKELDMYKQPVIEWLVNNTPIAGRKMNEIRDNFYTVELPTLVYDLSFDKLVTLSDSYVKALFYITSHVKQNTQFANPDDQRLEILTNQLRVVLGTDRSDLPLDYNKEFKEDYNVIKSDIKASIIDKEIVVDSSDINERQSVQNQIERYPSARFPYQVVLGDIVHLEVIIKAFKPSSSDYNYTIPAFLSRQNDTNEKEIPVKVFVECNYDEFEIVGNYVATINVPVEVKDSKSVIFNIKPKKEGEHSIQIIFLQKNTIVGEIKIKSFVSRTKNQGSLSIVDYKKEWISDYPTLENPIPGPDITTIYIREINLLQYDVLLIDSDVVYEMDSIKFQFNPETKFYKIFEEIENSNVLSMTKVDKEIKDIGMSLYDELFPEKLKKLYWELRDRIKSVRVISKEPWIPWEIIKPWRQLENGVGEEDDFLCERYAFSRWIGKRERIKKEVKNIKVIVPADTNLKAAIKEGEWIEEFAKNKNIKISFDSTYDQVINTLETEKEIDILHFSTHGQNNKESPVLSTIELEGHIQLQPKNLVGKAVTFGQSYPIVILNACQTGNQGFSLTGIQGWATKFLNAGASVFIGTLWSVDDVTAFNFVKEFYNQLASGITLGESVKNARNKCKREGDTSWLAYQLYGHPNSKIKF
jgi:uncharacterized caspase-like protein